MPTLRLLAVLVLAVLALAAVPSSLLAGMPAAAAAPGAGISGITPAGGYLGNYVAPDGSRVYCIDSALPWPSGATSPGSPVDDLTTQWGEPLPAATLDKISYVLAKFGETDQDELAAAVSAYLYAFTSEYARRHGPGIEAGLHYINGHPVVQGWFTAIWADVEKRAATGPTTDPATAEVVIEMSSWQTGTVTVHTSPADVTGELLLTGATVAETGVASAIISDGVPVSIVGSPVPSEAHYSISAVATLAVAPGPVIMLYTTGSQQRTVRAIASAASELAARAELGPISVPVAPVIVSKVLDPQPQPGDDVVDSLMVSLPSERAWPVDAAGTPIAIVAAGILYGPFPTQPSTADLPPAEAPMAATQDLLLTGVGEYRSTPTRVDAPGWYTWVWRIDSASQSEEARSILPEGYAFADRFGLPDETFVIAPQLAATGGEAVSPLLSLAALVLGAILLLGNTRRRRALR
jgi:hypothetical protein